MSPQPLPRYSDRDLPPYRYSPGGPDPHPVRDPDGHSFGGEIPVETLDPERWAQCDTYLYAIDLFNARYWWECHEALEALWRGSGRGTAVGAFLQGVIQLAAACLKKRAGNDDAGARLLERGSHSVLGAGGSLLGIDGPQLLDQVRAYVLGETSDEPQIRLRRA